MCQSEELESRRPRSRLSCRELHLWMSKAPASAVLGETETACFHNPSVARLLNAKWVGLDRLHSSEENANYTGANFPMQHSAASGTYFITGTYSPLQRPSYHFYSFTETPPQTLLGGNARLCLITGRLHLNGILWVRGVRKSSTYVVIVLLRVKFSDEQSAGVSCFCRDRHCLAFISPV